MIEFLLVFIIGVAVVISCAIAADEDQREQKEIRRQEEIRAIEEKVRAIEQRENELLQWKLNREPDCLAEMILDCIAAYPNLTYRDLCEKLNFLDVPFGSLEINMNLQKLSERPGTGEIFRKTCSDRSLIFELDDRKLKGGAGEVKHRKKRFKRREAQQKQEIRKAEEIRKKKEEERKRKEFELKSKLNNVDKMEGHKFEEFCAELLQNLGYSKVEVTKGSGDQGVDVLATKRNVKYAIQCKRYSSNLGNKPIQEVISGTMFYHCDKGVVLTNRYFTSGAKELAQATGVLLWDRDELKRMIQQAMDKFNKASEQVQSGKAKTAQKNTKNRPAG